MFRSAPAALVTSLAIASAAAPATAQNLLANPDFDSDATSGGWGANVDWIEGIYDAADAFDDPASGSVRVRNTRPGAGGGNGWFQCVPVTEGLLLDATVWLRAPAGQGNLVGGYLGVWAFGNPSCDFGGLLESVFSDAAMPADWTQIGVPGYTTPAGTQSLRFDLRVDKATADPEPADVLFDVAYLPEPASLAAALASIAALSALRGRWRRQRKL